MTEPLERRVEILEEQSNALKQLPVQVAALAAQVNAFRSEVQDEFAKLRTEMRDEFTKVHTEMRDEFALVRKEMREGDEESRSLARALHEDVIDRIKTMREG